ncbi:hypothetical protein GVAMD_0833 [Gardnerella vaginalis AMD]|nr:hypothetical protein GVAMD_0833 [Gardnerella vaginalis AMD]
MSFARQKAVETLRACKVMVGCALESPVDFQCEFRKRTLIARAFSHVCEYSLNL